METPKGLRDLTPEEMANRREVYESIREVFENYGFSEILTPVMENFSLFEKKSGPEIIDQLYAFEDKGGRLVALRPEMTASVARLFIDKYKVAPKPLKWYYIGNMFRYEEPQKGRYREFWQAGIELIGADEPISDAEVISVFIESLEKAGLENFTVNIGDRKILDAFAEDIGVEDHIQLMRTVDKRDKLSKNEFKSELRKLGLDNESIQKVAELTSLQGTIDEVLEKSEKIKIPEKRLNRIRKIFDLLESYGTVDRCKVDLGIARGLDYYTGIVFEAIPDVDVGSVGGGGRYDKMIEAFEGPKTPATGFAIGIDRLMDALEEKNRLKKSEKSDIYIKPIGETKKEALRLRKNLIENEMKVDIDLMDRNIGNFLDNADSKEIPFVILLGERELKDNSATIKDMESGDQKTIELEKVPEYFKNNLF